MKRFSYSEMTLWQRDRHEWYKRYVLGEDTPPTSQMILGTIVHKTLEDRRYGWMKDMLDNGFNRHDISMVRKLIDKMQRFNPPQKEVAMYASTKEEIPLIAIFDGFDYENRTLYEYKTTDSVDRWNGYIVDYNKQLSFYAYIYFLSRHKYLRQITLYALNTKTGSVKPFETVRSKRDIQEIAEMIDETVKEIKQCGWWDKRLSRKDRALKNNLTLI